MASRVLEKGVTRITQGYSKTHKAVDIGRSHITGEPVIAHSAGTVIFCQTGQTNKKGSVGNASYGNCVKIDHGNGYSTLYAHLATVNVQYGERVEQGHVIGRMGNTGNSYGTHLHFEIRRNNSRIDPTPYIETELPTSAVHVTYRGYTGRWLAKVTDCHDEGNSGYAGITGRAMTAVLAKPDVGMLKYRVHVKADGRWLPWVTNDADYAGNLGEEIDGVQMVLEDADGYEIRYRVSTVKGTGWHGWCTGLSDDSGDGYAGVFGKVIDRIQIKIVKV